VNIQETSKFLVFSPRSNIQAIWSTKKRHNGTVRILLVEDDEAIAQGLIDGLTELGFEVNHVRLGRDAIQAAAADLILLDLGLPDMDGRDVCRELRQSTNTPIIMLTARTDEFDRVLGLELGADDYVTKPFSFRELVARIRAVLRRISTEPNDTHRQTITVGELNIDLRAHRVTLNQLEIHLTPKEFALLTFLAKDPGAARTRSDILDNVWDINWYGPTKTVDAHIATLRQKLGDSRWIEAVRGVGFRLVQPGMRT
jgi:two-component system response regulator RegX3